MISTGIRRSCWATPSFSGKKQETRGEVRNDRVTPDYEVEVPALVTVDARSAITKAADSNSTQQRVIVCFPLLPSMAARACVECGSTDQLHFVLLHAER